MRGQGGGGVCGCGWAGGGRGRGGEGEGDGVQLEKEVDSCMCEGRVQEGGKVGGLCAQLAVTGAEDVVQGHPMWT